MELGLRGKTALITGGSRGIGLATARVLAGEGANLHLVAKDPARLQDVRNELQNVYAVDISTSAADLSTSAGMATVAADCPLPDILVNNAGAIPSGLLTDVDEATWRDAWDLKVFGFINMSRDYFGRFKRRGFGTIVNVIGMAGENPDAAYIAGSTGNAALMAFTRTLGGTSLADGIRVVGVNPGAVLTDRIEGKFRDIAATDLGDASRWRELMQFLPMQRAADPREVADTVAFLASARASYISGTIVTVDGGHASKNSSFR